MSIGRTVAIVGVLGGVGMAVYGYFFEITPDDIVFAARGGNVAKVKKLLERDPALVHAKVYPQAYERPSQRQEFQARFGRSPWEGKYLIHEVVQRNTGAAPLLDVLAAAGADLKVRRNGRTLLHEAAQDGNIEVTTWLIDHGADVNAVNDCSDKCAELGWTPLHNGQYFRSGEMSELLLTRGAAVDKTSANGRTPLHVAAGWEDLGGAFVLCRYGADPARKDASGRTPSDQALKSTPRPTGWTKPPDDPTDLPEWLKVDGGCAKIAAVAKRTGAPVPEDDARVMYSEYSCARGNKDACTAK